ncbi:hypothetical protein BST61_g3162 [Cercospora zeina]
MSEILRIDILFAFIELSSPWPFGRAATLAIALIALGICYSIYQLRFGPLHHIPGPPLGKITSLCLTWYEVSLRRNDQILAWHQQYGPIVCIAPNEVSVATVADVRTVYGSATRWEKSDYFDGFMAHNRRSVFASKTWKDHHQRRKHTFGYYQASNIYTDPKVEDRVRERALVVVASIAHTSDSTQEEEASAEVYSLCSWFAFDVITYLVLGPDDCSQTLDGDCVEILQELKSSQLVGPFGSRWQHKIRQELQALELQEDGLPAFSDVNALPVLDACLNEVYRLHPATSGRAERLVPEGQGNLAGYYVPAKTIATTSLPSLHRDPNYFEDPERFQPFRWLDLEDDTRKDRSAQLIPFGYPWQQWR